MKFEKTEVWGFEHALRGMRNPKESWGKSDSHFCEEDCPMILNEDDPAIECNDGKFKYCIGKDDMRLAQTLIKAGSEHRKFLRQIFVSVDITAPLYWWSEFDTYKVGTTANSTSTMHKIMSKSFNPYMFECDGMRGYKRQAEHIPNEVDEDSEEWKEYPLDATYLVSNQGRIKHISYTNTNGGTMRERVITGLAHNDGYIFVNIIKGDFEHEQIPKHYMVARTWIDNPENKPEINHKDGNKLNNHVDNLEWSTKNEDQYYPTNNNLQPVDVCTYKGKLSKEIRDKIVCRYSTDEISMKQLANEYEVSYTTIKSILGNKYDYGDGYEDEFQTFLKTIDELNELRDEWLITKDKEVWKTLIEKLPRNWLQTRTVTLNYENIYAMIHQRDHHKLNEWSGQDNPQLSNFISWTRELPYAREFFFIDEAICEQYQ